MRGKEEKRFQILAHIILAFLSFLAVVPFVLMIVSSLTDNNTLIANGYSFWPEKWSLYAYEYIFNTGNSVLHAYGISIVLTIVGTLIALILTTMLSYVISRKGLPGRGVITFLVVFTMLFNGGMVPSYIVWSNWIGVKDTIFAQLLPNLLLSAWNVMMIRTYFQTSIPDTLYEAAQIDGATQFRVFRSIVLPLGKPILVTMGTFAGLAYWNDWTNGLYYISKDKTLYNVQNLLNQMVQNIQYLSQSSDANMAAAASSIPTTGVQMAIAFVAILPIMLIFPYFSKYYTKGIALGAVKG